MRVLGIGAHPDDLEINCGGTLARYFQTGHQVTMAHACSGDKGHFTTEPSELAQIRAQEGQKAAALIGAESFWLGFDDGEIEGSLENRKIFIDLLRQVQADIVFTHSPEDYHADHMAVSRMVVDAAFMSTVPYIKTRHPALTKTPQIYFIEPYSGVHFEPELFVDISAAFHLKMEMMSSHQSQVVWLKAHDAIDILEYIQITARYRGFQCGKLYAEGFIRHQASLKGLTERLLP